MNIQCFCGLPATAFGLNGDIKVPTCNTHDKEVRDKYGQVFSIESYSFISTPEDFALHRKRKDMKTIGCGNLTNLEANCEKEKDEALKAIEAAMSNAMKSVQSRFEEMRTVVIATSDGIQSQLSSLRRELEEFVTSKDKTLSPTANLVCLKSTTTPAFLRFSIADAADRVSAVLSDSWKISTADFTSKMQCLDGSMKTAVIKSALAEASEYAKEGLPEALQFVESLIGDDQSFFEEKANVLTELLKVEKKRNEENCTWLQRSWDLRKQCAFSEATSVEVARQLASALYAQSGKTKEADSLLQHCVNAKEHTLEDLVWICGVYVSKAQYSKAVELGASIIRTPSPPPELYWKVLYYLTYSLRQQSKHLEARQIDTGEQSRGLSEEGSLLSKMLNELISGIDDYYDANKGGAKKIHEAMSIGISHFPTSPFTAHALYHLALVSSDNAREQYSLQARLIYDAVAPTSADAAMNLNYEGLLCKQRKRWDKAEERYRQARAIYEEAAPQSTLAAINHSDLGLLCWQRDRWSEAEERYLSAKAIFEKFAPRSFGAAINLNNLALLYKKSGKFDEAKRSHELAINIYEIIAPRSIEAGYNFLTMGLLLKAMKEYNGAIQCLKEAMLISEERGDTKLRTRAEEKIALFVRLQFK